MNNKKVLSWLLLLASINTYIGAMHNSELGFIFAVECANTLVQTVLSDSDDVIALKLLQTMNDSITFDATQKKALASSQNSFLYKGVPLDPAKIQAQHKILKKQIDNYNKDIKELKVSNNTLMPIHKKTIKEREHDRNETQQQLNDTWAIINTYAIQYPELVHNIIQQLFDHLATMNVSSPYEIQANVDSVNLLMLISKNQLAFEQALESYINFFGQCYTQAGSVYGSTTIISSKYNQDMPITPKEYTQLVTTLNNAYSQFGSAVTITLPLNNSTPATIQDVANYINNKSPQSSSFATYASYGLAAAATATAAIAASAIAYNMYQGPSNVHTN
jgi:hypothetical protein